MILPDERVGGYLRALRAGLDALAPHDDFPSVAAADTHLRAMDPAVSGSLLLPAELAAGTGMPAYVWLERVRAEARLLAQEGVPSAGLVAEALRLDPALGKRMQGRSQLHHLVGDAALLVPVRLSVQLVRLRPEVVVRLTFDHLEPSGTWLRVRAEATAPAGEAGLGAVTVLGSVATADDNLVHLLTRHAATPLLGLYEQLQTALDARVERLSVARIGPFWFPGIVLDDTVPAWMGSGLLLHAWREVLDSTVKGSVGVDPFRKPLDPGLRPAGLGFFAERRFAVHPRLEEPLRDWLDARGEVALVSALRLR